MFNSLKSISFGIVIGLIIGLWFGINIGKDQPIISNPFNDKPLQKKMLNSGGDFLEKSGRAIKENINRP
jgi:hypothetical protein